MASAPSRRFHIPSAVRQSPTRIERDEARQLIAAGGLLVHVRRTDEEPPALPGALRIAPDAIPARLDELPADAPVVLTCTCLGEATSVRMAHWLRDRGFEAYAVRGGVAARGMAPRRPRPRSPRRRPPPGRRWRSCGTSASGATRPASSSR